MKYFISIYFLLNVQAYAVDIDDILNKIDHLYRSDTSISKVQMEIKTPNWSRALSMDIWTKGMDYTFVVINSPRKEKGIATLKRKNEMWNFFPKINKVMKVPPSMMMSSWMGSDFTNDDLVKENTFRQDYNAKLTPTDGEDYLITLTPKQHTVSIWGKIKLHVNKKSLAPTQQHYFDENNIKIRTINFSDLQIVDGRKIPMIMKLTPYTNSKIGHETVIKYLSIKFNPKLPESTFTRRNLQKRR